MESHQVRFPGGDSGVFTASGIGKVGENIDRFLFVQVSPVHRCWVPV